MSTTKNLNDYLCALTPITSDTTLALLREARDALDAQRKRIEDLTRIVKETDYSVTLHVETAEKLRRTEIMLERARVLMVPGGRLAIERHDRWNDQYWDKGTMETFPKAFERINSPQTSATPDPRSTPVQQTAPGDHSPTEGC